MMKVKLSLGQFLRLLISIFIGGCFCFIILLRLEWFINRSTQIQIIITLVCTMLGGIGIYFFTPVGFWKNFRNLSYTTSMVILITLLYSIMLTSIIPIPQSVQGTRYSLVISATTKSNGLAQGQKVSVLEIRDVDGSIIPFEKIKKIGIWKEMDGTLVSVGDRPATLSYFIDPNAKGKIQILFGKNVESGIATIQRGNQLSQIDLYAPKREETSQSISVSKSNSYETINIAYQFASILTLSYLLLLSLSVFTKKLSPLIIKSSPIMGGAELILLSFFVGFFIWNIFTNLWTVPSPGDPILYIAPGVGATAQQGVFQFLDRIVVVIGEKLVTFFFPVRQYLAVPVYWAINRLCLLIICLTWAYRKAGFLAAMFVGLMFNASFLLLYCSTYGYSEPTSTIFVLLAFLSYFSSFLRKRRLKPAFIAGLMVAFACFSKAFGLVVLVCLIAYILYYRRWDELIELIVGFGLGTLAVLSLFVLLFSFQSLLDVLALFFKNNFQFYSTISQIHWDPSKMRSLSNYLPVLLDAAYFPLAALFISARMYKCKDLRPLLLLAWSNILFLYPIAILGMLKSAFAFYLDVANIAVIVALSVYLSHKFNKDPKYFNLQESISTHKVILGFSVIPLVFLGTQIGIRYDPTGIIAYNLAIPIYPVLIRALYLLGPLLAVIILTLVEITNKRWLVTALILITAIWSTSYNGGMAFALIKQNNELLRPLYSAAKLLDEVPVSNYAIFAQTFQKKLGSYAPRLVSVYRIFFDTKNPRATGSFNKIAEYDQKVYDNLKYVPNETDIPGITAKYILTDQTELITNAFPNAIVIDNYYWEGEKLDLLERSP